MKSILIMGMLILSIITGSCGGKNVESPRPSNVFPPNVQLFHYPIETVWQTLATVLRYDFLYVIAVQNRREHFLVTDFVRDEQNGIEFKQRLTASLKFEGQGVVVVLYKEMQVLTDGKWQQQATDYGIENNILKKLAERLSALPRPAK